MLQPSISLWYQHSHPYLTQVALPRTSSHLHPPTALLSQDSNQVPPPPGEYLFFVHPEGPAERSQFICLRDSDVPPLDLQQSQAWDHIHSYFHFPCSSQYRIQKQNRYLWRYRLVCTFPGSINSHKIFADTPFMETFFLEAMFPSSVCHLQLSRV